MAQKKASESEVTLPIVIDLGRVKKKRVRELKRAEGPLLDDVDDAVEHVRARLGDEADGKTFVPVVLVYRKKRKKKKKNRTSGLTVPVPFPPFFMKI